MCGWHGKGGSLDDMPLNPRLSESLGEWLRFLKAYKGHRMRQGGLTGVEFVGSELVLSCHSALIHRHTSPGLHTPGFPVFGDLVPVLLSWIQ